MNSIAATQQLLNIIDSPNLKKIIGLFDQMVIADEEIEFAKMQHPNQRALLHQCFLLLQPSGILNSVVGLAERIYRAHCRQLLERVVTGEKLEQPTDAEIMIIVMQGSLVGPLRNDYAYAYFKLFRQHFPDALPEIDEYKPQESWQGAGDEIIERMRKKSVERNKVPVLTQQSIFDTIAELMPV